ncbi:MAG: amidohydrolase family protein [Vicinamibacterales bacterium]
MKQLLAACAAIVTVIGSSGFAQPQGALRAFTGMRLFDGTGRVVVGDAAMIVRDGRITAVGPSASVQIPAGAARTTLEGRTVVPGLINAHGHIRNTARDTAVYAAYGVTTVHSLGDEGPDAFAARDNQNTAALDRTRLLLAGPVLDPSSPEDARQQVAANVRARSDLIKIRVDDNLGATPKMPPEIYRAVIDESHRQGLRTAVHLFYLADAKGVLRAGADLIAHSVRDADVDAELIGLLKARDVCLVPTLMREVSTFTYESTPAFFADPFFLAHADPAWIAELRDPARQARTKASPSAQRYKLALQQAKKNLKTLSDNGVRIAMGTDSGPVGRFQGYFELMELELMVEAGLTPEQALLAATRDAARCHHIDRDLGTLEPGKWADFVVLGADPLTDISNMRRIEAVYVAGNAVDR